MDVGHKKKLPKKKKKLQKHAYKSRAWQVKWPQKKKKQKANAARPKVKHALILCLPLSPLLSPSLPLFFSSLHWRKEEEEEKKLNKCWLQLSQKKQFASLRWLLFACLLRSVRRKVKYAHLFPTQLTACGRGRALQLLSPSTGQQLSLRLSAQSVSSSFELFRQIAFTLNFAAL